MAGPFTFWTFGERNFFANRRGEYLPLSADALRQRSDERRREAAQATDDVPRGTYLDLARRLGALRHNKLKTLEYQELGSNDAPH